MTTILTSILGMVILLLIAFLFSKNKKKINIRTVLLAFLLQFSLGGFVLATTIGKTVLLSISNGVQWVLSYAQEGIGFVFGPLADPSKVGGFVFVVNVLVFIVFFSSFISVLYHIGVMQIIIRMIGGLLSITLKTSKTESMSAAANIFVGQTEAPLVIKPYISTMTKSELFAVMSGGVASVAGSVLAGYSQMGIPMNYLIAASFMAAPGGLLFAKILIPETEKTTDDAKLAIKKTSVNVLDAAATGASSGIKLVINIAAMLVAFISLIYLVDGIFGEVSDLINKIFHINMPHLSLSMLLGWLFAPFAFIMGIPNNEILTAGSIIGTKTILNEFVAYGELIKYFPENASNYNVAVLSDKAIAILSFALCGFANLGSIAIILGGIGGMAPNRRNDIARMGMMAILAGTLSNFMSATIAGFFI